MAAVTSPASGGWEGVLRRKWGLPSSLFVHTNPHCRVVTLNPKKYSPDAEPDAVNGSKISRIHGPHKPWRVLFRSRHSPVLIPSRMRILRASSGLTKAAVQSTISRAMQAALRAPSLALHLGAQVRGSR